MEYSLHILAYGAANRENWSMASSFRYSVTVWAYAIESNGYGPENIILKALNWLLL